MSDYTDIKEGDEVRIVRTGKVKRITNNVPGLVAVIFDGRANPVYAKDTEIEVTGRAEPSYLPGGYYMADDRVIYQYDHDIFGVAGWFKWGGERVGFDVPKRPLRRMVPQDNGSSRGSDGF